MRDWSAPRKLLAPARRRILIFAGAAVVLVGGALARPEKAPPRLPEVPAPIMVERLEEREALRLSRAVRAAAQPLADQVVMIIRGPGRERPETWADWLRRPAPESVRVGLGLIVTPDGEVLTDATVLPSQRPDVRLAAGRTVAARLVAFDPDSGLGLLQLEGERLDLDAARLASGDVATGDLVFVAGPDPGGGLLAPTFVGDVANGSYLLSSVPPLVSGAPVFTLQGDALGVLGPAPRPVVHDAAAALRTLRRAVGTPLPAGLGVVVQAMDAALEARLGAGRLIVVAVAPGGPADRGGIQPGDVLVRLAEEDTADAEAMLRQLRGLTAGGAVECVIRRQKREQTLSLRPELLAGAAWFDPRPEPVPPSAPMAEALFSAPALEAVSVPATARVVTVDGRPPRGRPSANGPHVVLLADGPQRYFRVIAEPRS